MYFNIWGVSKFIHIICQSCFTRKTFFLFTLFFAFIIVNEATCSFLLHYFLRYIHVFISSFILINIELQNIE